MIDTQGKFYLGRVFDPAQGQLTPQPLLYEPQDLTTHAVVLGMTGSGKTGLCIDLLEEAALQGIPALVIDPKGDITNLLLHFPDLLPQDFQPWIDPDQARRAGQTLEQAAFEAAAVWRKGLTEWGIGPERLRALENAAHFAVFTPGSDAGLPVNILASLKAPLIPWESNRELLREKISGTVTALLGLVGMEDIDPVRSREHILLANIFEQAWSAGIDLDLGELILQTQTPPFSKLGVFDVDTFFPQKERFALAMLLNNILAAPAFEIWLEGTPLDIHSLLYGADGRPRHSVFYIAHLSDAERMFFVTLLYSAVETWMRAQSGTPSLRALVYFDEIFGYLPPVGNPPSKQPMLRMLKQARAFGVGQVLVTQNPVDVDYKALSNAGTWCIGKLQTEQDKQRLLDGLEGAAAGRIERAVYDGLISSLRKRVFLLHNVHSVPPSEAVQPLLFETRWAMNYLAGPLTRAQIPDLNLMAGVEANPAEPLFEGTAQGSGGARTETLQAAGSVPQARVPESAPPGSATRPSAPAGFGEYFLPNDLTFTQAFQAAGRPNAEQAYSQGLLYRPALLAQASVRFFNRKYNLDEELHLAVLVEQPERRGVVRWEDYLTGPFDLRRLDEQPDPDARFASLEAPLADAKLLGSLRKDFVDWVYRRAKVTVRANESLGLYAGPDVSPAQFRQMCSEAARKGRDEEGAKVADSYQRKVQTLEEKLAREERELEEDRVDLSQRRWEEMGTHAENFFSLFGSRRISRRLSTSLSKRRLTEKAKVEVDESREAIQDYQKQVSALVKEWDQALQEVLQRWGEVANQVSAIQVSPYKKDVLVEVFGVAWAPYHVVQIGEETIELPGFGHNID